MTHAEILSASLQSAAINSNGLRKRVNWSSETARNNPQSIIWVRVANYAPKGKTNGRERFLPFVFSFNMRNF